MPKKITIENMTINYNNKDEQKTKDDFKKFFDFLEYCAIISFAASCFLCPLAAPLILVGFIATKICHNKFCKN